MAGHESHNSALFEVPPITKHNKIDFGKSFDGADRKNPFEHGIRYSKEEIILLGGEDIALKLIGRDMLDNVKKREKETGFKRPYHEEITALKDDKEIEPSEEDTVLH